jgi:hypothetical protein
MASLKGVSFSNGVTLAKATDRVRLTPSAALLLRVSRPMH